MEIENPEIEIVDIEPVDGGVQVFARAWNNGVQIGFGKDGTVDIERFKFVNPPVLVPDINGDIVDITIEPITKVEIVSRFREDAEQATLQALTHTISVMKNLHDSTNIVSGKIGNTTTTVYPSSDGALGSRASGWATTHTGSSLVRDITSTYIGANVGIGTYRDSNHHIDKGFLEFDTSGISSGDTLDSAIFSLTSQFAEATQTATNPWFSIVQNNQAGTPIVTGDWGNLGTVEGSNRINASAVVANNTTYHDFTLNATGEGWVNFGGTTKLGIRIGDDILNTAPGSTSGLGNRSLWNSSKYTGTASDPKLVIEHSAGGAPANNGFLAWL